MRPRAGCAWIAIVVLLVMGEADARPSVGRAGGGGGGGRPAMGRPSPGPAARPQMPTARPQMPVTRPNMPSMQRPAAMPGGTGGIARPQTPNFQRPSVGAPQRPNLARPSLPNATARPQVAPPMPGISSRPGLGAIRPGAGTPARPGGLGGAGMTTKPAPRPGLPGSGGVGAGPASRPGGGFATRPSPSLRPGPGPTTKPSFPTPNFPGAGGGDLAGGNRPGGGGNRPSLGGGNRPVPLPGDLGGGNRPGRPGIGGNRPGIGAGNTIWNNGNWNSGNFNGNSFNNVNVGGGWGYPGWGGGGRYPGYGGGHGWVNPHYGSWYNGGWNGNWGGYNGGWWAPFAAGAATWGVLSSIGSWGLGYGTLGYGAAGYVNPYYASIPATVVAASPYDYSQPVVVTNYVTTDGTASETTGSPEGQGDASAAATQPPSAADVAVDDALAKFKAGDYAAALAGFDKALKLSPKDSVIHEVRALALFALGRYPEAAATLNSVLASAPGMDWTTISNVYGSVDAYTTHLRTLEDFCRRNPQDAAAHFVLAYHYLIGGHTDMAAAALKVVVAKQPGDVVAKRLLDAIEPDAEKTDSPETGAVPQKTGVESSAEQPLPEIDLVGTWKATSGKDTILLTVTADSKFSWKAQPDGKPTVELTGAIETSADALALVSASAGTMMARVTPRGADSFEFALPAAPKDATPLLFVRQP